MKWERRNWIKKNNNNGDSWTNEGSLDAAEIVQNDKMDI